MSTRDALNGEAVYKGSLRQTCLRGSGSLYFLARDPNKKLVKISDATRALQACISAMFHYFLLTTSRFVFISKNYILFSFFVFL